MSLDIAAFPEDFGEEEDPDPDALDVGLFWLVVPVVPVVAGVLAFVVAPEAGVLATTVLGAVVVPFKQLVLPV